MPRKPNPEDRPSARAALHVPPTPKDVREDVDAELRFHLEGRIEELMTGGMSRDDAETEARRRFGDTDRIGAELETIDGAVVRTRRRAEMFDALRREVAHATRGLIRNRSFSLIAVATLALGIGATTAIFTLLDAVVLRPLPFPSADRLVRIDHRVPRFSPDRTWGLSAAQYFYFARHAKTLEQLGVFTTPTPIAMIEGVAERMQAAQVTPSLLSILGARPVLGRLITADDDRPGAPNVGLLSHDVWMQRYAGDRAIIGQSVDVEGVSVEIIGVLAAGIELPDLPVAIWMRSGLDPAARAMNRHHLQAIARLRPGVSPEDARIELESLVQRFPAELPSAYSTDFFDRTGFTPQVIPLRDAVVGGIARVLWILIASVGLVLLIACANVANLFLVRAEARRREIAIRSALGAERSHLAWHFLTESVLLSGLGGALAILVAYGALATLIAIAPAGIPRLSDVALGWRSVAFTAFVAIGAGIIFGLFPLGQRALNLSVLRGGGRGLMLSRGQHRVRSALVTGQVALALVLLAGAGLMLQSVRHLRRVDPGFDPRGVLAMDISLPARYATDAAVSGFYQEFTRRIGELPGVSHAGASTMLALRGTEGCSAAWVEDKQAGKEGVGCIPSRIVAPGYFEALGIAIRGTPPTWRETQQLAAGAVVTQALAERLWPGEDALGKGIKPNGGEPPFYRVVGVTANLHEEGLDKPATEAVFYPVQPIPGWPPPRNMTVVVRTATTGPEALTAAIRETLLGIDPRVPLENVETMEQVVAGSIARRSFTMLLLVVAASMALLLSVVGIFGVISYVVSQRRPEIGVRIALGARASQVSRLIVGQALRLALLGIVIGLAAALVTTRVLHALLFEVSATDPAVLVAVSVLLLGFAALASYAPARRSARVDPAEVLRAE